MRAPSRLTSLAAALVLLGCGSSDDSAKKACSVQLLDPTEPHYGKTQAEWAEGWLKWVNETDPTDKCKDPQSDATGEDCGYGQDPGSPVVFLPGSSGGTAERPSCKVSKDKAIFIAILNFAADNAGVANPLSDDDNKKMAEDALAQTLEVGLSVDGCTESHLDKYYLLAPYTVVIPPEPNRYSCQGVNGISGSFDGWTAGYYVLLPPLAPGSHSIVSSGRVNSDPEDFVISVAFDPLVVE